MGNEASQSSTVSAEALVNNITVSWKRVQGDGTPLLGRDGHCACACNGKLYVFGGVLQDTNGEHIESNQLVVFDPISDNWQIINASGDVPSPRSAATMACVGSDLYLFGGLSNNSGWLGDVHIFKTDSNSWVRKSTTGKGPSPRDKLSSAVVGNEIYIFGGFGPKSPEDMEEDLEESGEDSIDDDDDDEDEEGTAKFGWFDDIFIYHTENHSWSQPMQMNRKGPTPRAALAMCSVNHHLVIFGGRDSTGRQNDLHIYDTHSRKWIADLVVSGRFPEPRSFHTATAVGTRVVIIGGRGVNDQHFNDLHIFDSVTCQWLQPVIDGDILTARGVHTATLVGDKIVIFGGSSDFDKESMQCTRYHNDFYAVSSDDILRGGASQTMNGTANQENISSSANQESNPVSDSQKTNSISANQEDASSLNNHIKI